ncbi:MAG: S49 family peptidase [Candidatus Paceibacterota bacterium]
MLSLKSIIKSLSILIVILTVLAFWSEKYDQAFNEDYLDGTASYRSGSCNVASIKIRGSLDTYTISGEEDTTSSENIVAAIDQAEQNDSIKAILLDIDSIGGYPVAGEEIANAIKRAQKPTVAVIRQSGTSAAYWTASSTKRIFASSLSDIGAIGVTMSYLDNTAKNEKEGLTYNEVSSGRFKDAGDPNKLLAPEERAIFERDVKIMHEKFISAVATNRSLDTEKVRTLADGSIMLGDAALANGLIDEIGGIFEAREYLRGIIGEDAAVCK